MNSENSGIAPRVLNAIFSCKNVVKVAISFIQVYNEQAFDLLSDKPQVSFIPFNNRGTMQANVRQNMNAIIHFLHYRS